MAFPRKHFVGRGERELDQPPVDARDRPVAGAERPRVPHVQRRRGLVHLVDDGDRVGLVQFDLLGGVDCPRRRRTGVAGVEVTVVRVLVLLAERRLTPREAGSAGRT